MSAASVILTFITLCIRVYDLLTGWIYSLLHSPAKLVKKHRAIRAVPCKPIKTGDTSTTWKPVPVPGSDLVRDFEHAQLGTMAEVWTWVVSRY